MGEIRNWVREDASAPGAGNVSLDLGAPNPTDVTFLEAFGASDTVVEYSIEDASGNMETGEGTFRHATTTLERTIPRSTFTGGTYDDTSPVPINFGSQVAVRCALSAEGFDSKLDGVDSTFESHTKYASEGQTNNPSGVTTIDFTPTNQHELTGTGSITLDLGNSTFPGIGKYTVLIDSGVTVSAVDDGVNGIEYGDSAYSFGAGSRHLVAIHYGGGSLIHWQASPAV